MLHKIEKKKAVESILLIFRETNYLFDFSMIILIKIYKKLCKFFNFIRKAVIGAKIKRKSVKIGFMYLIKCTILSTLYF